MLLRKKAQPVEPEDSPPVNADVPAPTTATASVPFEVSEQLPNTPPSLHHHVSESTKQSLNITAWLADNIEDPATVV